MTTSPKQRSTADASPSSKKSRATAKLLSAEGLECIANHKYVAGKYTPLDNLLNPFWLWLVELLPRWLAPNLVTFSGFLPMVVCYMLLWWSSPDLKTPVPRSVAFFAAGSLWFYQTMDALDGKQARRTKASSPLGQLFDHGCDCLACLSHHSMAAMIFLPGGTQWTMGGQTALQTFFFLGQWQEYYTGVLSTSYGPVGVTETQYALIVGTLLSGIVGPEWMRTVMTTDVNVGFQGPVSVGTICIQGWIVFCSIMSGITIYNTLSQAKAEKRIMQALLDLFPITVLNVLLFSWEPTVTLTMPRLVCFLTGILFFYYTATIILFSMAHMPYPIINFSLLPYASLVLASWLAPSCLAWAFPVVTALTCFWVLRWVLNVVSQLKEKLGIYVFVIQPPEKNQ